MMKLRKKISAWHKGLGNTLKFWDPKKVRKGIKKQWSLDPLGRKLNSLGQMFKTNSARAYSSVSSDYGMTGSIVGRY